MMIAINLEKLATEITAVLLIYTDLSTFNDISVVTSQTNG